MSIKVKFEEGTFKPLEKVKNIKEGDELEIHIETDDFHALAMAGESFEFLKDEPDIYSEEDIIER